jgi:hypothetical protein
MSSKHEYCRLLDKEHAGCRLGADDRQPGKAGKRDRILKIVSLLI